MATTNNKFIVTTYKLFTVEGENKTQLEEATAEKPCSFITGFGFVLESFEKKVSGLAKGDKFSFKLQPEEAFGTREEGNVLTQSKESFKINGHFDHDNIYAGANVPLQDEAGNHFIGKVLEVTDTEVKIDLNHPLAGKEIMFEGEILESRDATTEEVERIKESLAHPHHHCCCHHHDGEEGEHHCHCHDEEDGEHHCHCHDDEDGEHHCHCHDHE